MTEKDDFFKSDEVEEQIDLLAQWPKHHEETNSQAARVISHLRQFYATDSAKHAPNLERAWQRIVDERQRVTQDSQEKGYLIIMQERHTEQKNRQKPGNKRTVVQWLGILAAVAVVGIVIGSALLVSHSAQEVKTASATPKAQISSRTGSGGTPTAKPPHPITGGACTIDTTVTHPQQSTSDLPGLYSFEENTQGDNVLYRYDRATNKVVWSKKLCNSFESAGTVEKNGILYLAGYDVTHMTTSGSVAYLYALNETDGSAIWGVQFPAKTIPNPILKMHPEVTYPKNMGPSPMDLGMIEAPTVANGMIYIMQRSGIVYAVDATTGSQRWTFDAGRNSVVTDSEGNATQTDPSSIQIINGVAYGSITDRFFALNANSGKALWTHSFDNKLNINQNPAIANGTIYLTTFVPGYGHVATPDTYIYAFNAQTGSQKWVSVKMQGYVNAPVASSNQVNVTSYDGIWYTLNASTGAIKSQKQLPGGSTVADTGAGGGTGASAGSPELINGVLYNIAGTTGLTPTTLAVLNPDGSTKWSAPVTAAYPAIDDVQNGVIYVSGRGTGIYAYSATNGSLLWHYDGYLSQPEGTLTVSVVS
jgi:outer membrane protein assembly factor BamB